MLEPAHRFMWYLFKMYNTDDFEDPRIVGMNPVLRHWMFVSWAKDQEDSAELLKSHGYLVASFINPEEVKRILDTDNKHISNEEEFEESLDMVKKGELELSDELSAILNRDIDKNRRPNFSKNESSEENVKNKRRRRRRIIK